MTKKIIDFVRMTNSTKPWEVRWAGLLSWPSGGLSSEVTHDTSTQSAGERSDPTALPRLVCARTSRFGPCGRLAHRTTHLAQRPELRNSCLNHHREYLCRNGAFVDSNDMTLRLSVITVVAPRCCDRPGQFVYQSEHIGLLHTF